MSDLISRQAAINSLTEIIMNLKNVYGDMGSAVNGARECIKSLPSAEPERKKGKWLHKPNEYDDDTYECSRCGEPWTLIEGTPKENNMNYCPNCGADMRGDI